MDKAFEQLAATFVTAFLTPLAEYAKTNADIIKSSEIRDIVTAFRAVAAVPTIAQIPAPAPALAPALSPALGGGGMPAGLSSIGSLGAPVGGTKGKRVSGAGSKAAQAAQRWITIDQFRQEHARKAQICSYLPNRGAEGKKGNVCAGPASNATSEPDQLKWRCVCCDGKTGDITKKFTSSTSGMRPTGVPGFNMPAGAPGSVIPAMPVFASVPLPGAATLPPQLPGSMSLPAMPAGLPSSLPTSGMPLPIGIPQPLPLSLPPGASPPAMPGPSVLPLPGGPAPVAASTPAPVQQQAQFNVIQNAQVAGVYFVGNEKYRQLAIMEQGENLVCIGKLSFKPTEKSDIPADWSKTMTEPSADDFAYLKAERVLYGFGGNNPTPIA
ncbi:Hypothetical protein POVN_LOCUS478 [uncultured virus]|nr:Hypothetical protein POVN_LOCUS478 [uncultured virus]